MNEYVFISYKFEQKDIALKIKNILEENGISCWMAPESIPGGSNYASEITGAIDNCKEVLIILSSLAQESKYIIKEIDSAIKRNKVILPFMIEDFVLNNALEYYLTDVQRYLAFQSWENALEKMIREIRWTFQSINSIPNPNTIIRDPIKIGSSLPHVLENGYLIFGRYRIKKMLGIYFTSQQHYLGIDEHTNKEVMINYIDRTLPYEEQGFGISTSGTLFQHSYIASPIDEYSNESYFVHVEPFYDVKSLSTIVFNNGSQNYIDVMRWAIAICHAMIYLNDEMGYIYGYMIPRNIRLQKNGLPILFDVSVATPINSLYHPFDDLTIFAQLQSGCVLASPVLDIYMLGLNMYIALTGDIPQICNIKINLELVPKCIRMVIKKCFAANKKGGYKTFHDVLHDLEHITLSDSKENFIMRFIKNMKPNYQ